jgi:hypothetical protein
VIYSLIGQGSLLSVKQDLWLESRAARADALNVIRLCFTDLYTLIVGAAVVPDQIAYLRLREAGDAQARFDSTQVAEVRSSLLTRISAGFVRFPPDAAAPVLSKRSQRHHCRFLAPAGGDARLTSTAIALLGLNRTSRLGGTSTRVPVRGFRPT